MPHKAQIVDFHEPTDGILAVRVRCCGDEKTDSVISIHELHRTNEEIDKDIQNYLAVAELKHEQKMRAKEHIARLMGQDCGCK